MGRAVLLRCVLVGAFVFAAILSGLCYPSIPHAVAADAGQGANSAGNSNTAPAKMSEADAFAAAKELDTVDGWKAFLKAYPSGFRADLARAYIQKLSGAAEAPPPAAAAPAAATSTPPSPPPGPPPAAPVSATAPLPTVDLGQGSTPWQYTLFRPLKSAGGAVPAATVQANGVELITYCNAHRNLGMVLRANPPGVYPEFQQRLRQGLTKYIGQAVNPWAKRINTKFSNGDEFPLSVEMWPNGDLAITDPGNAQGFPTNGVMVPRLMSQSWVRFSAPPFQTTIQLTGSRQALCSVFAKCGARLPAGCAPPAPPPGPPPRSHPSCGPGYFWRNGRCHPRFVQCGPGHHLYRGRCVRDHYEHGQDPNWPSVHGCKRGQVWDIQRFCHYPP